jgi:hypothetical protein
MEGLLKFTIEDRIRLYSLLPEKGTYELLKAVKECEPNIRFDEEETRIFDIKQEVDPETNQGMVFYSKEVAVAAAEKGEYKEVKIPPQLLSYMVDKLEKLSQAGEMEFAFIDIYERLVLGKDFPKVKKNTIKAKEVKVGNTSTKSKEHNG